MFKRKNKNKNKNKDININTDAEAAETSSEPQEDTVTDVSEAFPQDEKIYTLPPQRKRDLPGNEGDEQETHERSPSEQPESEEELEPEITEDAAEVPEQDDIGEYFGEYIGEMPDVALDMSVRVKIHEFLYQPVRVRFNYRIIAIIASAVAAISIIGIGAILFFMPRGAGQTPSPVAVAQSPETATEPAHNVEDAVIETPAPTPTPVLSATPATETEAPVSEAEKAPETAVVESPLSDTAARSDALPESVTIDLGDTDSEYAALDDAGKTLWAEKKANRIFDKKFGEPKKISTSDTTTDIFEDDVYRYTFDKASVHPFVSLNLINPANGTIGEIVESGKRTRFIHDILERITGRQVETIWSMDIDGNTYQIPIKGEPLVFSVTFNDNDALVEVLQSSEE